MPAFSSTDELTVFSNALNGQYEVEREIGRGGMGVVYLARDLRLDRMVAIKTLPSHLANDPAIRERFLREARTAARLSHPNIVPVHRADEVGGQVFFVMGFVDGESLAATLDASRSLSPRRALPILRDVSAALGYAHRHGVVHRDVKTENILLETVGGRALVTDFGIARMGEAAPLTATGQILGTVYYLSPEQVSGEPSDARSDIYALGVVGYAMLAGQFPFDGPLASAVLVAHVNKQAVPLSVVAPHVPASLASIIDRCLAKNPAHRFQTCADLGAALASAEGDANRVTIASPKSHSPLVSNTEAQVIFKRAAELETLTGAYTAPEPISRDKARDAARREGYRTANLRDAAREAGIAPEFVQHALAERGLSAPAAKPTKGDAITDLSDRATFFGGEPTQLCYEAVLDGELREQDFDLMVDTIRRRAGDWSAGQVSTVGRSLTWTSHKSSRRVQITIFPRNGKTTIRVLEAIGDATVRIHTGVMAGMGLGMGWIVMAVVQRTAEFLAYSDRRGFGLGIWLGIVMPLSLLMSRFLADRLSMKRQKSVEALIEELATKAKESIDYNKD